MLCFGGVCLPLFPVLLLLVRPILAILPTWITEPIANFFRNLVAAIFPGVAGGEPHSSEFVKRLASAEDLKAAPVAIVKFGASWCPPCRRIAPAYAAIAEEFKASSVFFDVDVDATPDVCSEVSSIPAFAVYRNGKREGPLFSGADAAKLREFVAMAVAGGKKTD